MIRLFDPELLPVIYALAGALAGWLLRGRQSSVPPELADLFQAVQTRRRQQQAQTLLHDLTEAASTPERRSSP